MEDLALTGTIIGGVVLVALLGAFTDSARLGTTFLAVVKS